MAHYVKKKPYPQQLNSIYHFYVIKIIVLHELNLLNIPWETFISHEAFKVPQVFSSVHQEEGGPSGHDQVKENGTVGVPVFVTYERGTRKLFIAAMRVLSPQGVEGVSPSSTGHRQMLSLQGVEGALHSSSAKQVHVGQHSKEKGKAKEKMQEEDPSDEQKRDFGLVVHEETQGIDVIDVETQSTQITKDIIKKQEADIQALSINLEREKWIINYLEQENKKLIDKQVIMELQMIKEKQQEAKKAKVKMTSIGQEIENDQETWLERVNMHLEKANKEKNMLRHMAYHYMTRNKICNIRMRKLKARLRKALRRKKDQNKLEILADASLAHQRSA